MKRQVKSKQQRCMEQQSGKQQQTGPKPPGKTKRTPAYRDISVDELPRFMKDRRPVVLDMRDSISFKGGHLEGAQQADELHIQRLMKHKSRAVLVYCYHGHSSRDLAEFLCQMGLTEVFNLAGGWQALHDYLDRQSKQFSTGLQVWLQQHGFRGEAEARHVIHARIDRAMSTLMLAALDGDADIAHELLELGADLHAENSDGNQSLWFACVCASLPVIGLLLHAGANVNHINQNGYTCLMYAASTGKLAVVEALLAAGADTHLHTPDGLDALEFSSTLPVLKRLKAASAMH